MKYGFYLMLVCVLCGCLDTIDFSENNTVIVKAIITDNESCKYRVSDGYGMSENYIITECNLYGIGDTVRLEYTQ